MEKLYSRPSSRCVLPVVPREEEHDPNWSLSLLPTPSQGPNVPQPLAQQKHRRVPKVLHKVQVRVLIQLAFITAYFKNIDLLIQARPMDICT